MAWLSTCWLRCRWGCSNPLCILKILGRLGLGPARLWEGSASEWMGSILSPSPPALLCAITLGGGFSRSILLVPPQDECEVVLGTRCWIYLGVWCLGVFWSGELGAPTGSLVSGLPGSWVLLMLGIILGSVMSRGLLPPVGLSLARLAWLCHPWACACIQPVGI